MSRPGPPTTWRCLLRLPSLLTVPGDPLAGLMLAAGGVLWLAVALAPQVALADGKAFGGVDLSAMRPIGQREQAAAILHRDGIERLAIAVNLELGDADHGLWIFPVPGTPERTKLDIVDSFPLFWGEDPRRRAADAIGRLMMAVRLTQVYPVVFEGMCLSALSTTGRGVVVHADAEKWGLRTEAITASSLEDLLGYLRQKKAGVAREDLAAFEPYLSDRYVLVATWITSRDELAKRFPDYAIVKRPGLGRYPCLYVEFLTEHPFYPLKPTSGYGDKYIPVTLFVVGCVKPQTSRGLLERTSARCFRQRRRPDHGPSKFVDKLPTDSFYYTRIRIAAEASAYTDDLWFAPADPPDTRYADGVLALAHPAAAIPLGILIIGGLSYLSAGICALALYDRWRGFARVGLWNLLTLVGLVLAIRHIPGERGKMLRSTVTQSGIRMRFSILFTVVYLALAIALQVLLLLPLV